MEKIRKITLLFLLTALLAVGLFLQFYLFRPAAALDLASAGMDSRQTVQLPILMYHSILASGEAESEYALTVDTLERDLAWLTENNYTTVSAAQLIAYVNGHGHLPEKPVLLTFDDGYCNNYTLAYPLLEKYQAKAIISVIGSEAEASSDDIYRNPKSCTLSLGEIRLLEESGLVEIGNHTYDLHEYGSRHGADRKKGESMEDYRRVLLSDLSHNQQLLAAAAGTTPTVFAWPFGAYPTDGSANPVLKEAGFQLSLTSYQKMNTIKQGDPDSLFNLKRFLRTPNFSLPDHLSPPQ